MTRPRVDPAAIDELEVAFARIVPLVKSQMQSVAARVHPDLRPAGWQVLRTVLHHEHEQPGAPLTVSEVIAATQMDKSVVSRQLRDLREWGLVAVARSSADARVFLVESTELARERNRAIQAQARAEYRKALSEWDPEDVRHLTALLLRLVESASRAR